MIRKIVNSYFPKKGYYFLLINRFKSFHEINLLLGDNWTSLYLRWNPLGNFQMSSFNFQLTKTACTRIISSIFHFFSHFSRAINVIISCIIKLRRRGSLYWSPRKRKTNFKSFTFYKMRCLQWQIYLYCVFSITMKLKFIFSRSR